MGSTVPVPLSDPNIKTVSGPLSHLSHCPIFCSSIHADFLIGSASPSYPRITGTLRFVPLSHSAPSTNSNFLFRCTPLSHPKIISRSPSVPLCRFASLSHFTPPFATRRANSKRGQLQQPTYTGLALSSLRWKSVISLTIRVSESALSETAEPRAAARIQNKGGIIARRRHRSSLLALYANEGAKLRLKGNVAAGITGSPGLTQESPKLGVQLYRSNTHTRCKGGWILSC